MSTIINSPNPSQPERTVVQSDGSAGWVVAVVILIAVIAFGAYFWTRMRTPAMPQNAEIKVTLPAPNGDGNNGDTNTN